MSDYDEAFTDTRPPATNPGAALLDGLARFLARFVAYPSEAARIAHALWIVHTHLMDCWESTPRIAFLSPEPGSGKSRCLEVTEPLVPRPVHAVNTTPAYLFRKVSDPDGTPTILYDEIDTVFGPRAKDNEDIRGMLNAGHRKGAMAGRCVVRGKTVETEELPAYCAVALAGLDDLPDTLMSRSVVVRMRRRAPTEQVEPWRLRVNGPDAAELAGRIADWADEIRTDVDGAWPVMPEQVQDRDADVWEALLAVADAAGGNWPARARAAAVTLVTAVTGSASIGVLLLGDLRRVFDGREFVPTSELLASLLALEESPWNDLRGKSLDANSLARRLRKYEVKATQQRIEGKVTRGYLAADLADAWTRYLPEPQPDSDDDRTTPVPPHEPGTPGTAVTRGAASVTGVPGVPALRDRTARPCGHPGDPATRCGTCVAEQLNAATPPARECRLCDRPAVADAEWCDTDDAAHRHARGLLGVAS